MIIRIYKLLPVFLLALNSCSAPIKWATTPDPLTTSPAVTQYWGGTPAAASVETGTAEPGATQRPAAVCVVWTGFDRGSVNVREGPGMTYPVIDIAWEGEILTLTHYQPLEGWIEIVSPEGVKGYFYTSWCKK